MNKKFLFFDTLYACHEKNQTYIYNILDGIKTKQNVPEQVPVSADPVPVPDDPFLNIYGLLMKLNQPETFPALQRIFGPVQFHQRPLMLIKWVRRYGDLFRDVFVHLAFLSTSDFRCYICRLGTLWSCYITQKLFSPNPGTFHQHI